MRTAFIDTLVELAEQDERVMLLTADLGWSVLERFSQRFPDRFVNVGVAEQNMLGLATGFAQVGYIPYVYSIATFSSMRCYEQIRNGPVLHHLPVKIIGIGGGYAYGHAGPTHHALEDLAIGRIQPGLTVVAPCDPRQAATAMRKTKDLPGPVYLRIGKNKSPEVPGLDGRFALGRPEVVREGTDCLYVCTGEIVQETLKAADLLAAEGVSACVAVLAHLEFTPGPAVHRLLSRFGNVVSVEEGYVAGGLGSLLAQAIAEEGHHCRLATCGVKQVFPETSGSTDYMRKQMGLTAPQIARQVQIEWVTQRRAA